MRKICALIRWIDMLWLVGVFENYQEFGNAIIPLKPFIVLFQVPPSEVLVVIKSQNPLLSCYFNH